MGKSMVSCKFSLKPIHWFIKNSSVGSYERIQAEAIPMAFHIDTSTQDISSISTMKNTLVPGCMDNQLDIQRTGPGLRSFEVNLPRWLRMVTALGLRRQRGNICLRSCVTLLDVDRLRKEWRKHPHISKAKTININQPPKEIWWSL